MAERHSLRGQRLFLRSLSRTGLLQGFEPGPAAALLAPIQQGGQW